VKPSISHDELKKIVGRYDGLVVRSASKVKRDVIDCAKNLKVVGRAGIGLDNVDVPAATEKGILVMNTPGSNAIAAAEHTIMLLLALARHVAQAHASMKAGKWEKKKFMGVEVYNQILGVIGLGSIGSLVAERALGLKMKVIGCDPYTSEDTAAKLGVSLVSLDELLKRSDYITVHTPLTSETRNVLSASAFRKMKGGVRLINCARGGIVSEADLHKAIKSGKVAGAALDVFEKEPPGDHPLLRLDQVICTPHLGASTKQAQVNVAVAIAEQIIDYLQRGIIRNAANVPSVSPEVLEALRPYLVLAEKMGRFQAQISKGRVKEVKVGYGGEVLLRDVAPIRVALTKGLLEPTLAEAVNFVNAPVIARNRGIQITEQRSSETGGFSSLITLAVKTDEGENAIAGTLFGKDEPRIVRINGFITEAVPEGNMLYMYNYDKAGVIGSIGTTLGRQGVNIANMHLSRNKKGGKAISLIQVDAVLPDKVLDKVRKLPHVISAIQIAL
jgi:D-3-phosphoglycerate dehydrogenase